MKAKVKPAIETRIDAGGLAEIDALVQETGQGRSDWLYQVIREALRRSD